MSICQVNLKLTLMESNMHTVFPTEPIFDFNEWIKYIREEVNKSK